MPACETSGFTALHLNLHTSFHAMVYLSSAAMHLHADALRRLSRTTAQQLVLALTRCPPCCLKNRASTGAHAALAAAAASSRYQLPWGGPNVVDVDLHS